MNLAIVVLMAAGFQAAAPQPTPNDAAPIKCFDCDEWNQPQAPFRLHGDSYYVGVQGLSAILIKTSAGLILLDAGLPQSAPLIEDNIRSLGFRVEDVKLIVNSHAHYDHAGGIARIQRVSGAEVAASASGAEALMAGRPVPDDPQYGVDGSTGLFPKVAKVRIVKDLETLRVGDTLVTAHLTPGHTPGSTSWTWSSCVDGTCLNMVYADSLTALSLDGFRYTGDAHHPDLSAAFERSIDKVGALPCDIMVSTHPGASGLLEKLAGRAGSPDVDPFVDKESCSRYADGARRRLSERLKTERNPNH